MQNYYGVFYVVSVAFCFLVSWAAIPAYQKFSAGKSAALKVDATVDETVGLARRRVENATTLQNQDWYCAVKNRQTGPFTLVQLKHVLSRFASDELYVWNVGMEERKRPQEIPELTALQT